MSMCLSTVYNTAKLWYGTKKPRIDRVSVQYQFRYGTLKEVDGML